MQTFLLFALLWSFSEQTSANPAGQLNSDLPFGFWFGGNGPVRRQVGGSGPRTPDIPLQQRSGRSINTRELPEAGKTDMADLIAELLLMNLKREVSTDDREAGGEASFAPQMYRPYARLAAHYAYDDAQEELEQEFLENLRNKKRSPEVAQALSQFKNERMILMGGNPGNKIMRPPADWGKMLMKRQNQLIFNPV